MSLKLGAETPDFEAETTEGTINFYDWAGDSWGWCCFSSDRDSNVFEAGHGMLPADVSGDPARPGRWRIIRRCRNVVCRTSGRIRTSS